MLANCADAGKTKPTKFGGLHTNSNDEKSDHARDANVPIAKVARVAYSGQIPPFPVTGFAIISLVCICFSVLKRP